MKVQPGQIGARLDRPSADIRLYLFHGPDEAGATALADRLADHLGDDVERVDMDPASLRGSPGRLIDEAASLSLFGGSRYIRVTGAGEEIGEAAQRLLDAPQAGNPVVVIAPGVKTSGKLVKLAIASPIAISTGCYVPEGAAAARLAATMAADQGVRLTTAAAATLWEATGGDRAVLAKEIDKLCLYLDATPDKPREADGAVLEAIGASLDSAELYGAIDAIVAGDAARAGEEMQALEDAGVSVIALLRQLARKMLTLAKLRAEVDAGASIEDAIGRNRIFFRERAPTARALRSWRSDQIAHALHRIREAERATLAHSTLDTIFADQMVLAMARAAARSRR
ncbi:DNA polymerase III subunit delta [Stakelama saccharophila]|uniref:DNA-directed DNA polymerase n=1 Tax=Stakelama saccharophila TaxID=3075605 RepID=A0ABZ0B9E7_9SPHN|nr:DNA polymerase III subunit delta [Stakelama sp. W311]WNO54014.1 DNA polymerase III subunit delta [Stakelama sp. W311]